MRAHKGSVKRAVWLGTAALRKCMEGTLQNQNRMSLTVVVINWHVPLPHLLTCCSTRVRLSATLATYASLVGIPACQVVVILLLASALSSGQFETRKQCIITRVLDTLHV